MNLTDPHSPDVLALPEDERVSLHKHLKFRDRMDRERPWEADRRCAHGVWQPTFVKQCPWCKREGVPWS